MSDTFCNQNQICFTLPLNTLKTSLFDRVSSDRIEHFGVVPSESQELPSQEQLAQQEQQAQLAQQAKQAHLRAQRFTNTTTSITRKSDLLNNLLKLMPGTDINKLDALITNQPDKLMSTIHNVVMSQLPVNNLLQRNNVLTHIHSMINEIHRISTTSLNKEQFSNSSDVQAAVDKATQIARNEMDNRLKISLTDAVNKL